MFFFLVSRTTGALMKTSQNRFFVLPWGRSGLFFRAKGWLPCMGHLNLGDGFKYPKNLQQDRRFTGSVGKVPFNFWWKICFYAHPYLVRWSNLTSVFLKNGLVQPPTFAMYFPRILIEEILWKPLSNLKSTGFFVSLQEMQWNPSMVACVPPPCLSKIRFGNPPLKLECLDRVSSSKSVISIKTPKVLGFPRLFQGFARWWSTEVVPFINRSFK